MQELFRGERPWALPWFDKVSPTIRALIETDLKALAAAVLAAGGLSVAYLMNPPYKASACRSLRNHWPSRLSHPLPLNRGLSSPPIPYRSRHPSAR